jgi:hypothetical protein
LLSPIPELLLDETYHRYSYRGELLARSVSEVVGYQLTDIQRAGMERYKNGPKGWAARGAAIHKVLEHHLKGVPCVHDEMWEPWIEPLLNEALFNRIQLHACEYRLVDEARSMGGSFDFLVELDEPGSSGLMVLGDLKTVSSAQALKRRKPATAQLGAYLGMLQQHHPDLRVDQCVTVVSGPEGCRVIREDPEDCRAAWEDIWARYELDQPDF